MTTDRELMQMALDVMEAAIKAGDWKVDGACDPDLVLTVLRARLAQPEQEPLWIRNEEGKLELHAPLQREWQGLTDEEIEDVCWTEVDQRLRSFARAIEAKLKEKNT